MLKNYFFLESSSYFETNQPLKKHTYIFLIKLKTDDFYPFFTKDKRYSFAANFIKILKLN